MANATWQTPVAQAKEDNAGRDLHQTPSELDRVFYAYVPHIGPIWQQSDFRVD